MIETKIIEKNRELTHTQTIEAPRERVFKAWTDPKQLAQWWGPRGFTNPVAEIDPRPGGAIRVDMRGPDGTVYPMMGTVREIVEPERLVFTSAAFEDENGDPQLEDLNTVTFKEAGGRTELTWHEVVTKSTPQVAQALEGMEEGSRQSLERLAEFLKKA